MNRRVYFSLWPIYGIAVGLTFMASSKIGVWVAIIGASVLGIVSSVAFFGKGRSEP